MNRRIAPTLIAFGSLGASLAAAPLTTAFTYQGQLKEGGAPAAGAYDFEFRLFDLAAGGAQQGSMIPKNDVLVENGLITVDLDFGPAFDGNRRWLDVRVRDGASAGAFTPLTSRQELTAAPYALYALGGPGGSGPWQTSGANIFNTNTGNVGIGTNSPVSRLTVAGAGAFNSPSAAAITLDNTTAARRWEWHALDDGRMQLADFTAAATRMVFDLNGRVGIGTAAPQFPLTVYSPGGYGIVHTDGVTELGSYLSLGGGWLGTRSNHPLYLFTNNSIAQVTLTTAGYVGIGTTTPPFPLTVYTNANYGFIHTDGIREVGSYVNSQGGWLGTRSNHPLHLFAANSSPQVTLTTSGNLGIGTTTPTSRLDATATGPGAKAVTGNSPGGNGVWGTSSAAGYAATGGVNAAVGGFGVYGQSNSGPSAKGIWGNSDEGTGVYGTCNSAQSEDSAGVLGRNTASNGTGVIGEANTGGQAYGVWGRTSQGAGVFGEGNRGVVGVGAIGVEAVGTVAVRAHGSAEVIGDLSVVGEKSFRIDHPNDPENKYLLHYCTEGPQPLNVYRGTVILDANGKGEVNLPDYLEDINKDFSYALTAVGAPMPDLHVATEVAENQFSIAGGTPGGKVSWQVSGVRNDLWVQRHGAAVEMDKPEHERGKYQHPELYGLPEERGMFHRPSAKPRN